MLRTTTHSGELLQPRDLGKIEHNVHVLHSLARSALDQIVNHRDHLHHVCGFIHSNADAAHVRALDFPKARGVSDLSLIHISEPTRRTPISYAVFCLKKKKTKQK